MPAFLATMQAKIIAVGLLVALIGGAILYIYGKGETAGAGKVTGAVQEKTIEALDKARNDKEKTNEKVRRTPLDDLIDRL